MTRTGRAVVALVWLVVGCSGSSGSGASDDGGAVGEADAVLPSEVVEDAEEVSVSCRVSDRYEAEDLGPVMRWSGVPGLSEGATLADNTSYLTGEGQVRLYFWANQGQDLLHGVRSAVSDDGVAFTVEDGMRIDGPYGHPKLVQLGDAGFRMLHLVPGGIGSSWSDDGLSYDHEDGLRLTSADAGLEKVGGVSVVALADGGYRGYFSDLGLPGVPPGPTRLKSATSPDTLTWTIDEGVRIGEDAPHLTGWSRQPFAHPRGGGCVTLFYYKVDSVPTRIATSTALDGLTFTDEHPIDIVGFEGPQAGPNVQQLGDGSLVLYYDAQDPSEGNHIRAARLTLAE